MSREKEIIEEGIKYTLKNRPNVLAGDRFSEEMREFNRNKAFEEIAKWADKTIIDKACKWLLNIDFDGQEFRDCDELFNNDLFVNAFRKAVEK
jgi:hypothetical protein